MSTASNSMESYYERGASRANVADKDHGPDVRLVDAPKSKKRQECRQDGSQGKTSRNCWPIIIDNSDSTMQRASHGSPRKKQRRSRKSEKAYQNNQSNISHSLLGAYDDILTDTLVDGISYGGVARKYYPLYSSSGRDEQTTISILRDAVIKGKDLPTAERQLLAIPSLKSFSDNLKSTSEKDGLRRHLRRYLNIYLPDCAFEISGTNRYTILTHEAKIIARKPIKKGEEIKYLCGVRAILAEGEAEELRRRGQHFSIVESKRNHSTSVLLGPVRFLNHDCDKNANLIATGSNGMKVIAVKDISIGEEITVDYGEYFGDNNRDCLCKTCEDRCENGWTPEKPVVFNGSPKPSPRYLFRHKRVEGLSAVKSNRSRSNTLSASLRSASARKLVEVDTNAHSGQFARQHERARTTSHDLVRSSRVPGDHLTSVSHIWVHFDRCLEGVSMREDDTSDSCPVCERHRKLYGYRWPKTKQTGKFDNEERIYSPVPS